MSSTCFMTNSAEIMGSKTIHQNCRWIFMPISIFMHIAKFWFSNMFLFSRTLSCSKTRTEISPDSSIPARRCNRMARWSGRFRWFFAHRARLTSRTFRTTRKIVVSLSAVGPTTAQAFGMNTFFPVLISVERYCWISFWTTMHPTIQLQLVTTQCHISFPGNQS